MAVTVKKIEDLSPIKKKMEVSLPTEEVTSALNQAYQKIQQKAHIKGFRPGKVPQSVLEQYYKPDAEEGALRELVNKSYPEALTEAGLLPVSPPEIQVNEFGGEKGLHYLATFEVRPEIEVRGYDGLKLTQDKLGVEEKEVQERLEFLRERAARLVPVSDSRKPKAGDVVTIHYAGFAGERNFTNGIVKDYVAELGKGYLLADFEKELLTFDKGETRKIRLKLPADFPEKTLAGQEVIYEVTLGDLKEKILPEPNDEFAKDLGPFQTLEEIKTRIQSDVQKEKEHHGRAQLKEQIVEKLLEKNQFLVPEGMIHGELEAMWRSFLNYLQNQGIPQEKSGVTLEEFFAKNRDVAIKRVQTLLLFEAVAKKENISVSSDEIQKKFEEMAPAVKQSPESLRKMYEGRGLITPLEESLRAEKTLDFVLGTAKIKMRS
ncbi:MAG: trigger factor [Deltaproteobacteria bacterium]|nr:trigger factor [Deltaproteobacteria bacterium]